MAPPKPRFDDGEKVLCFHGPLLYEAKCLKSQIKDKHLKYFIHYSGWNKNWDEWVPECRVLKYNDTNLQKQAELKNFHTKDKKSKSAKTTKRDLNKSSSPLEPGQSSEQGPSSEQDTSESGPPKPALPKATSSKPVPFKAATPKIPKAPKTKPSEKTPESLSIIEQPSPEPPDVEITLEEYYADEPSEVETQIRFDIPEALNDWLADDWDYINNQKKILELPLRNTVDHLIAKYILTRVTHKTLPASVENAMVTVTNAFRNLFNATLGRTLLYRFEKPQYLDVLHNHKDLEMSQIYGAIHLIRLFSSVDLKQMIEISESSEDKSATSFNGGASQLKNHVDDFLKFISENPDVFDCDEYVVASPEYHRKAM